MQRGPIGSFHLVRERAGRAPRALARLGTDRPELSRTPGLRFWRVLGTGRGASTAPGADLRRTALFAVWEDEADLERFLQRSPIAARWPDADEHYTVRLRALGGHGSWRGHDVLAGLVPGDGRAFVPGTPGEQGAGTPGEQGAGIAGGPPADAPVAVLTRAVVRPGAWLPFLRASRAVSREVAAADGLLAVVGIGEAPFGRQATFSLWRRGPDAMAFAYGGGRHAAVIRSTRRGHWYGEELFARFQPYASEGTWDGSDPLRA
jgi:hypothetical protein